MGEENEYLGLIASAGRSFCSALVVACFLSIALLVIETDPRAPRTDRVRRTSPLPQVRPLPQPPTVVPPPSSSGQGGVYPYPMFRIPPRSHRFDRSDEAPIRDPDVLPVLLKSVPPRFTGEARRARVSGIVIMEVVIEADGTVSRGHVVKALPFGLTNSAIESVRQWRYRPGMVQGKPVPTIMNVVVNFRWPPPDDK